MIAAHRLLAVLALVPLLAFGPALDTVGVLAHEHDGRDEHAHVLAVNLVDAHDAAELEHWHEGQHESSPSSQHAEAPVSLPHGQVVIVAGPAPLSSARAVVAAAMVLQPLVPACPVFGHPSCPHASRPAPNAPPPGGTRSGVERLLLSSHALLI